MEPKFDYLVSLLGTETKFNYLVSLWGNETETWPTKHLLEISFLVSQYRNYYSYDFSLSLQFLSTNLKMPNTLMVLLRIATTQLDIAHTVH